jgi:hypothetical protein
VTLRTDHVVGTAFIAFALVVLAMSGDLPFGTLSFPGAGMMPKVVAGAIIILGLVLILRAGESEPLASIAWGDLSHAVPVIVITALAIAAYQTLGFIVTMTLLLFTLIFGAERRHPLAAAAYSVGITLLTWLLFSVALKTPLETGIFGF